MREYKDRIKTVLHILSYFALFVLIIKIESLIVAVVSAFFWLFIWSFNIYDKLKYRSERKLNEIRFPTQNDSYFKITSLTLGLMVLIGSVTWLILMNKFTFIPIIGLLAGILIFTNGLIDLPKGRIKFDGLNIELQGAKKEILISEVRLIELWHDKLIVYDNQNNCIMIDKLDLTDKWLVKINTFMNLYLDTDRVEIKYDSIV